MKPRRISLEKSKQWRRNSATPFQTRSSWKWNYRMLEKGACETCEGDERGSYCGNRIEQIEKELAESEAISAEVPGLQETYAQAVFGFR
jgi:hypothetical protein